MGMRNKIERKVHKSALKKGDMVMIIAGGNKKKKVLKGKTGKVLRFVGSDRLVVEGLNFVTRHQRAAGPNKPAGKIQKEAPMHVSNVMYFVEKISKPVRLRYNFIEGGKDGKKRKVRGYIDPKSKQFVQIDA